MLPQVTIASDRHLETLHNCGGYYLCPKDQQGRRTGPLVGYAGTYKDLSGKQMQFVGDTYANFAMVEPHSNVLKYFAQIILRRLYSATNFDIDAFVGAPIGGYSLTDALGFEMTGARMIKAEKQVVALKTETSREKSKLVFGRHNIGKGWKCAIVEDVCNNFSTTGELVNLITKAGGVVVAIACFLNRSLTIDDEFICQVDDTAGGERAVGIPVVCVVRKRIVEYNQDDPAVSADVEKGNVVWKPKDEWNRLMKAMDANK